jgi:hypothetical protein
LRENLNTPSVTSAVVGENRVNIGADASHGLVALIIITGPMAARLNPRTRRSSQPIRDRLLEGSSCCKAKLKTSVELMMIGGKMITPGTSCFISFDMRPHSTFI